MFHRYLFRCNKQLCCVKRLYAGSLFIFDSITLEGREKVTLQVTGSVVNASLELLTFESEQPLQCVKFGTTYYGTDATQSGMLFNNSPKSVCFVIVLNDEAAGQETVSDII